MNYKKGTQSRGCMKGVMRYVAQENKTLWNGEQLISGIGCQPETAFDEFLSTKLLHHKDGGVQFYHMVQSFPKGTDIDPRTAHEAARQLAGYFEGCEILVCTHTDREHIHSHCIINSVNFETGRKVHMADEQIQELRIRNDEICEKLGLPKFQRDEQRQSHGMSNAEYYTAVKGESWKFELMRVIDECMRCAGNREEFLVLLRSEGYNAIEVILAERRCLNDSRRADRELLDRVCERFRFRRLLRLCRFRWLILCLCRLLHRLLRLRFRFAARGKRKNQAQAEQNCKKFFHHYSSGSFASYKRAALSSPRNAARLYLDGIGFAYELMVVLYQTERSSGSSPGGCFFPQPAQMRNPPRGI